MYVFDGLPIRGYEDSISPYRITDPFSVSGGAKRYDWVSNVNEDGSMPGQEPTRENVERKHKMLVFPRFTAAATNLATNPRGISGTGWSASGTIGSGPTADTNDFVDGEQSLSVTTNGNANTGIRYAFTGTVAAYSAAIMVKAPEGAPMEFLFDGETPTAFTATGEWQLVVTENKTLTAASRYAQVIQTDTGSRTFRVCPLLIVQAAAVPTDNKGRSAIFHGSCGDAKWNGTPDASTSTCLVGIEGTQKAIGALAARFKKADTRAQIGSASQMIWQPKGAAYCNFMDVVGGEVSEIDYDHKFETQSIAACEITFNCLPLGKRSERLIGTWYKAGGPPALVIDIGSEAIGDLPGPMRVEIDNTSSSDFRYVLAGSQWQDSDTSKDLIVRAASFGVSGFSGTLTTKTDEVQTLSRTGTPASGTFTLTLDGRTTSAIAYNASAATIQAALEALGNIGSGNVACTGGPIHTTNVVVTFQADLAGCNINLMTVTDSVGGGDITCSATTAGVPGYVSAALYDEWTAICDSGAIGLTGSYRLVAIVYDNSSTSDVGKVTLRLAKGVGDAQIVDVETYRTIAAVGDYSIVDFGPVSIPVVPSGTQQWKVRVDGKTSGTAGSTCRIVDLLFCPISMLDGEVRAVDDSGGVLSMLDNFGATSGALTGDTATTGQTWASIGGSVSATDFTETAAPDNAVIRTADNDNSTDLRRGRGVVLGSSTPTDVRVGVDCSTATVVSAQGVIARFTDANNFVFGGLSWVLSPPNVRIGYYLVKVVAGTVSTVGYTSQTLADTSGTRRVELTVRDSGLITLAVDGIVHVSTQDAVFATGGALASGKSGILDWAISGGTGTRTYSDFRVSIPTAGQIAIHDGQSLDFRPDGSVWREVAAGSIYTQPQTQTVAVPPKLGPYGDDGISNRLMVAAGRFNPDLASHPYADPFTVKVYEEPVYEVGAHLE